MSDLALPIRSPPDLALGERLSSDEWLARLVSRGSARAFAVLYQRHHQALYRYCRSIVHDEHDAEDALQSAMMRALVALQARERDLAVRPWLFRIVHNEAVSLLRRRRPNASLVEGLEPADGGMEATLEQRERFAALMADLQSLAERQRAALVMRELSGLSIEEIAAALSTSPGAAKQALFEARCALQEFEEGRAMECEDVRRAVSDGDGRVLRARKIRSHLRACRGCRDFQLMIDTRTADLHALASPLAATAATAMLARLLAHGAGGGHAGGVVAASGAAFGGHAAASMTVKALAAVAITAAATAGTVQLASGPHPRRPTASPARRSVPSSSGVAGVGAGALRGVRVSTAQPLRGDLKAPGAGIATSGGTPRVVHVSPRGVPAPIGTQRAGGAHGMGSGREGSAAPVRPGSRRSGSSQSRRNSHGQRSPKQGKPAPRQQAGKRKQGQTVPAGEHSHGRAGLGLSIETPGEESPRSSLQRTTPAG